ncbi:MAG: patatin-like phospholipase family protein, partial [Planctomycetaceae bacterium]|nr:patatin-like phospholipase family protein [Planctomycetaceae bacterium]
MIALFVSLALAVSQDASGPPGVALVLSGGGARTVAAVGVLEELERLHVPVDFVVGCEGGALIGGLYAAGRTPAEVARLVAGDDWIDAIEGREARRTLSWRRRVESRDFLFEVPVTLREGSVALPKGLLRTRRLNLLVDSESLVALGESEFDEERFFKLLKSLKGRFLITYGIRGKFPDLVKGSDFWSKRIRTRRSIAHMRGVGGSSVLTQLLVANYEPTTKALDDEFVLDDWDGALDEGDDDVEKAQPFGTFGGSFHYAKRIVPLIPAHKTYVEP